MAQGAPFSTTQAKLISILFRPFFSSRNNREVAQERTFSQPLLLFERICPFQKESFFPSSHIQRCVQTSHQRQTRNSLWRRQKESKMKRITSAKTMLITTSNGTIMMIIRLTVSFSNSINRLREVKSCLSSC